MHGFDINEYFFKYRYIILIILVGLILIFAGIFVIRNSKNWGSTKVEVLSESTEVTESKNVTVEIAGEVIKPGVYKLPDGSRVDDVLIAAGGFSVKADRAWTDKYLNRAAKLIDGQKLFIPKIGELAPHQDYQSSVRGANKTREDQSVSPQNTSDSNGLININSASLNQLDSLPGIGQVYGQSIIEHRPYSTVEELLSKGVLKKNVYEKIKDLVSVY